MPVDSIYKIISNIQKLRISHTGTLAHRVLQPARIVVVRDDKDANSRRALIELSVIVRQGEWEGSLLDRCFESSVCVGRSCLIGINYEANRVGGLCRKLIHVVKQDGWKLGNTPPELNGDSLFVSFQKIWHYHTTKLGFPVSIYLGKGRRDDLTPYWINRFSK